MKLFACLAATTMGFNPMLLSVLNSNSDSTKSGDSTLQNLMMMQAFGGMGGNGQMGGISPLLALSLFEDSSTSSSSDGTSTETGSIPTSDSSSTSSDTSSDSSSSSSLVDMMMMQSMMGGGMGAGMMSNPMFLLGMLDGKEGNSDETLNSLIQMNMMNQMAATPGQPAGMNNGGMNPLLLASMLGDSTSDGSSSGLDMTSLMLMGGLGGQGGMGDLGLMSLLGGTGTSSSGASASTGTDAGIFEPSADNISLMALLNGKK